MYEEDGVIRYTEFPLGVGFQTTDSVGTGANPSIGYMNSSGNPEIHVVWQSGTKLYYRSKSGGSWNSREYILNNGKRPCLEVVGSAVHVVCEKGDDIYHCETYYIEGDHDWSQERILDTSSSSTLPVITGGDVCVWVENVGGSNKEIVYSWNSLCGWSGADTISETSECSDYPHIVHKQTLDTTRVYCIWTENDSKPYDILFKSFWVGEGGSFDDGDPNEEPDMPFYIVECGETEPSAFNLRREGYTQYGSQYYNKIDFDSEYLEYKFEGLNPDREYALSAYAYHQENSSLEITVNVENIQIGKMTVPANTPVELGEMVPSPLYKDGIVYVTIHGEKAVSSAFVLYEYERTSGKGGGPQDMKVTSLNVERLVLNVFPNPVRKDICVQYTIPRKTRVKLSIYDVAGRLVRTLINSTQKPGSYQQTFNTGNLSQGVYFVRLHTGDKSIVEKVVFLR